MKAGRELDALIAEKVFGLKIEWEHYAAGSRPMVIEEDVRGNKMAPHYSTQIADAWLVVEKMKTNNYCFTLYDAYDPEWAALFSPRDAELNLAEAATAPLAICLSALKAVGVETDDEIRD